MNEEKNIPKHWEVKRLGELCDLQNGVAFKSKDYVEFSKTLVFRMSQIRPGGILDLNHNSRYLPDEFNEIYKDYRLKEADIVIAMTDMAAETRILGVPTYFKSDGRNYLLNQRVGRLFNINYEKINIHFLRYVLTAPIINRYYKSFGKGALQINLGKNDILNALILTPPLPEQQAIVEKIEEMFSSLDKGIESLKTAQKQLKVYRQAVLKWAFDKYDKSATIGDLFDFVGGGTPSKSEPQYWNGNICWCSVKDVKGDFLFKTEDKITEEGLTNSASNLARKDQVILITRISPGKTIISKIQTAINQDLKIIKPKTRCSSLYVHYLFQSLERTCIKLSSGTTVLGINLTNLKSIEIPNISYEEQQLIVAEIESRLSVCDKIEEGIEQSLKQSESLRQSILKKAFEGKLVHQDHNDEPAGVLLDRIRAARKKDKPENPPHWQTEKTKMKKAKS